MNTIPSVLLYAQYKVDSMLSNAPSSSFSQSDRLCASRDAGVPGPGSYARGSSLGCQVSSTHNNIRVEESAAQVHLRYVAYVR